MRVSERVEVKREAIIVGEDLVAAAYKPQLGDYNGSALSIVVPGFLRGMEDGGAAHQIAEHVARYTGSLVIGFSPSGSYENSARNGGKFTFPGLVRDIREIVENINDGRCVNLIGYSMGGAACARFVSESLAEGVAYDFNSLVLLQTPPEAAAHRGFTEYAACLAEIEGRFDVVGAGGEKSVIVTPPGMLQEYEKLGSMREALGDVAARSDALKILFVHSKHDVHIGREANAAFAGEMGRIVTCEEVLGVRHDTVQAGSLERLMQPVFASGILGGVAVRAA